MRLFVSVALVMQLSLTCNGFTSNPVRFQQYARGGKSLAKTQVRAAVRMSETATKAQKGASGVGNLNRWDPSAQQAFIQPAFHNKNPVRVAALLAVVGLAARGSWLVPGLLSQFFHIMAFSAWMGSNLWVTFIAGITMFRNMPRQTFGKIQSKLFPAYFQLHCGAITSIFILRGCPFTTRAGISLIISMVFTSLNLFLLEPISTNILFKRYALENEDKTSSEEYKELGKQFGKFHGASSLSNLVALGGAITYAWDLAAILPA